MAEPRRRSAARSPHLLPAVLALLLLATLGGCGPWSVAPAAPEGQKGEPPLAWLQFGPDGLLIARAIAGARECPTITLDATAQSMAERAPATADFPHVCEAVVPPGTAVATVQGQALPVPRGVPRRVAIIGDSGCTISTGWPPQACNDPAAWPFPRVAESAAAWQPDLVIHVGDYLYRFAPCPAGNAGCAGSPWGDNWGGWQADVFAPAAPLLRAAPWVFVRGNHELCDEGGYGWFRFFEPRPWTASCASYTDPYAIPLGDLQLIVFDSAAADDYTVHPDQVAVYRAQFDAVRAMASENAWLLTHRPLWAVGQNDEDTGIEKLFRTNPTLQAALGGALPPGVRLVHSGHLHLFEVLSFFPERPPQFVIGNSGTLLDPAITSPLTGLVVAGATVSTGTSVDQFGYLTVEPAADGWSTTLRDQRGGPSAACAVRGRAVECGE